MVTIINGNKIKEEMLVSIKEEVAELPFVPVFCDVLVGDDLASMQYVRMKANVAESVGIKFHGASFPASITLPELIFEIEKLNKVENMCGIIVQLPLPGHLDRASVLNAIDPSLDVDCLGEETNKIFYGGDTHLGYPAALACMRMLDEVNMDLNAKKIVVLGQGILVGKPVTWLLKMRGLNPITLDSKTENKEALIKDADVIITGIGKGKYITGDMIKEGAVVIDAGTSEIDSGIVGDVDLDSVKGVAGFVSPVPGGVGPVTVATLLKNVLAVAKSK